MVIPKSLGIVVICTTIISGCAYLKAVNFPQDDRSGVVGETSVDLALVDAVDAVDATDENIRQRLPSLSRFLNPNPADNSLITSLENHCNLREDAIVKGFVDSTIAAPAATQLILQLRAYFQSRLEKLYERSEHKYTANLALNPKKFGYQDQCLILVRSHETDGDIPDPTFILVAKIELRVPTDRNSASSPMNSCHQIGADKRTCAAFTLNPVFLFLDRSVAVTEAGKGVQVSVSLAGHMIRQGSEGPTKKEAYLGSFTVKKANLGNETTDLPKSSELIAMIPDDALSLELRAAVVENGSGLPDAERAKAELKAIADALGSVVKTKIEELD